jgi:hypothetical protein
MDKLIQAEQAGVPEPLPAPAIAAE